MPADQIRNRTVGCKMTDSEYERLSSVVESEGMTLGEWCREVLLERADGRKPSVIEETLLAEVLALRTILLNAFYRLAQGENPTDPIQNRAVNHGKNGWREYMQRNDCQHRDVGEQL
jgi:hypothetical protein